MKVLVLDKLSTEAHGYLSARGLEVIERLGLKESELIEAVGDCTAMLIRSSSKITEAVLDAAKHLKVIGRAGVGLDNVDVAAATRRGVIVMNTPSASTITTAELAVALLMALSRNIPQAHGSLRRGEWKRSEFVGREICGKQAGVIGLGRIGLEVAIRLKKLGMRVCSFDPYVSAETARNFEIELVELEELIESSEYITLHTPLTERTRHLLGTDEIARMKPGVRLINCARGGLIDEAALLEGLESGQVAGAALDVFEREPPLAGDPLVRHPRVIVTPHLGASTVEAQAKVSKDVAEQVAAALLDGRIENAVNAPNLGAEMAVRMEKFRKLAMALGAMTAQLARGRPVGVEVEYSGMPSDLPRGLLLRSGLGAILSRFLEFGAVNSVNATLIAEERGIHVREISSVSSLPYTNLLRVTLRTDRETRVVAGTVLPHGVLRILDLDGVLLEASPSQYMLVSVNLDIPGVIGKMGTLLGANGVNIGGMQLGRSKGGEQAISIVSIDADLPAGVLEQLEELPEILETTLVQLEEV